MPHACKISEVIELLQQHQHDDVVLCSVWYEDVYAMWMTLLRQKRPERHYAMQPVITTQNRALTGSHRRPHLTPSGSNVPR